MTEILSHLGRGGSSRYGWTP